MRPHRCTPLVGLFVCLLASAGHCATVLVTHSGDNDPTTESPSWTRIVNGSGGGADGGGTGAGSGDFGIADDGGFAAWRIDEDGAGEVNLTRTQYRFFPTDAQDIDAMSLGWRLDVRMRVTDANNPNNNSRIVEFVSDTAAAGSEVREFMMDFGSDAAGNATVRLRTSTTATDGPLINTGDSGYNLYSLIYDPGADTADLYINGGEAATGYAGFTRDVFAEPIVRFGGISTDAIGEANYNLVEFTIDPEPIPEPTTGVLAATAALLLVGAGVWRHRRRA